MADKEEIKEEPKKEAEEKPAKAVKKAVKQEGNQEKPSVLEEKTKPESRRGQEEPETERTAVRKENNMKTSGGVRRSLKLGEPEVPAVRKEPAAKTESAAVPSADVLKFVYMTEKAIRNIEKENRLVFIVDRAASKDEIRAAVETGYKENVADVNTLIDQKGRKKAVIKFVKPNAASDVAIKLGII